MPLVSALRKGQPAQAYLKNNRCFARQPPHTPTHKTLVVALHVGIGKKGIQGMPAKSKLLSQISCYVCALCRASLIPRAARCDVRLYQVGRVYCTNHIRRTYLTTAPARMHDGVGDHFLSKIHNRASRPTRRAGGTA